MSDYDFNTPPWIIQPIASLDTRGIGLDPCSNAWSMVGAKTNYTILEDGLAQIWRGHGLVFVNPPHSMKPYHIEPWMDKAWSQFEIIDREESPHDSLVMLIPAKTDTRWFHNYVTRFDARCFLKGRPKFWHHGRPRSGSGKFASMVCYRGLSVGRFFAAFDGYGWIV